MQKLERELVGRGLLSKERVEEALRAASGARRPLVEILLEGRYLAEADLLRVQADLHAMRFVDLKTEEVASSAIKSVPAKLASHYRILPLLLREGILTIAVSNPSDAAAVEDIETNLGFRVERVLACRADIDEALNRFYGVGADTVEKILAETPEREARAARDDSHDLEKMAEDASVVRLVNQLLQEAIDERATDIHLEIHAGGVAVRRRIDGVLYDASMARNLHLLYPAIVSRVKLMSGLNIVERRLPQDGRARVNVGAQQFDLRVSIVPSLYGEDVVIRILPTAMLLDLGHLGLTEPHLLILKGLLDRPHGILFVTGPTGSGKSTTLYACLRRLNTRENKILTIEDPVEYELPGITQTQVNPKIGLTFSRSLRSMLRHDPDIMMVGEVRDRETAEIAIQTAMTGHLVLSTLHTNDAAGGAVRLIDMGIDPYLVTSTVQVFVAQRLVRVICTACREAFEAEGRRLYRGRGCRQCNQSGYHGRIGIFEFLPLEPSIRSLIMQKAPAKAIRDAADSLGMGTLAQDGWDKVSRGVTTAEEVLRVTAL